MSYRTLVELNHDYCPTEAKLLEWAKAMVAYMRSGFPAELPKGVTWKDMRHHSDPERVPAKGFLEVGLTPEGEVVINHPDLKPDAEGVGHIVFSPMQARNLAMMLIKNADLAGKQIVPRETKDA